MNRTKLFLIIQFIELEIILNTFRVFFRWRYVCTFHAKKIVKYA